MNSMKKCRNIQDESDEVDSELDPIFVATMKRKQNHMTSDLDTFLHLVKANIGTGLLALPMAVKNAGYIIGPVGILLIGFLSTHCMGLLLESSKKLCQWINVSTLDYSETMQLALRKRGFNRNLAKVGKIIVNVFLIMTQLGFCSVYFIFIADSLQQILKEAYCATFPQKLLIVMFIFPIVLFCWIRNLNTLSPLSFIANLSIVIGLIVVLYDEVFQFVNKEGAAITKSHACGNLMSISLFTGTALYSLEGIGVVLPLENKMQKPTHAKRVIYLGMVIVTVLFASFGITGYLSYGDTLQASVTLNLCPKNEITAVFFLLAKLLFVLGIFVSYMLQFYVPMDIMEPFLHRGLDRLIRKLPSTCTTHETVLKATLQLCFRTIVVLLTASLALSIPNLGDLITLVGSMASSTLSMIFPPLIHMLTFWKNSQRNSSILLRHFWIVKDIVIVFFGVLGFAFGTYASVNSIINDIAHKNNTVFCTSTFMSSCDLQH